jgi:transposase-like protein
MPLKIASLYRYHKYWSSMQRRHNILTVYVMNTIKRLLYRFMLLKNYELVPVP